MIISIKPTILIVIACFLITACAQPPEKCVEGINVLPKFGGVEKCKEQIETDKKFIAETDKSMSRKQSTSYFAKQGWKYLYADKLDTAIMRFNQAWLLDSLNADVYWGFGNILGKQAKFEDALPFFERAAKLDPKNIKIFQDMSTSYGNVFFQTKDIKFLELSIKALKSASSLEPKNAAIYAQLAGAYSYFAKRDSADKYFKIADQIDPKAINPEVRKILSRK
jgi:tetratricopeptide (TPR) repeat protein